MCMKRYPRALLLLLALAGCGAYPQPFAGNPGATARRLAQPPPTRLAVPAPGDALLDDRSAADFAGALADQLAAMEVPAVAGPPRPGDWQLVIHANLRGGSVMPSFQVIDPKGKPMGDAAGDPASASAWANGDRATLAQSAASAAPKLATLLTAIQATIARSDPNSLLNRPAHIFVAPTKGAPGNGNRELTMQMRAQLPQAGELVQDVPDNADFTVRCEVMAVPSVGEQTRVEIQWIVDDSRGERGRVVQINDVPRGSLNGMWGDVAAVVAEQGAAGVRNIITNSAGGASPDKPAAPEPP